MWRNLEAVTWQNQELNNEKMKWYTEILKEKEELT